MDEFVIVPTLALGFYLFLMVVFVTSKRTELKWPLLRLVAMDVTWAFGSVCMRLNLAPSYQFWFYVSLFGIYLLPMAMLDFALKYIGGRMRWKYKSLLVGSFVLFWFNVLSGGFFIAPPELIATERGIRFVYTSTDFWSVCPYLYLALILFCIIWELSLARRSRQLDAREFWLLVSGKGLLVLGNVLISVPPFQGYPTDMLAGLLDALLMTFLLCSSSRFKQTLSTSGRLYEILILMSLMFPISLALDPYTHFLLRMFGHVPSVVDHAPKLVAITAMFVLLLMYALNQYLTVRVFRKDRELRIAKLNEFSNRSCQTLDINKIYEMIRETTELVMDTEWAGMCIWDKETCIYQCDREILDTGKANGTKRVRLLADNALIRYAQTCHRAISVSALLQEKDLDWELCGQLTLMQDKGIELIRPIYTESKLHALLLIKGRKKRYSEEEEQYLESIASVSSVAIKNAEMYGAAYWEARRDELTGIWNRKYFYEMLKGCQKNEKLSLALLKIDDFRIYNQLYGNDEGDHTMQKVAGMIRDIVGKEGLVFRYAATEFIVLLREYSAEEARQLMENVRLAVMGIDYVREQRQMMITVSCGVYELAADEEPRENIVKKCMMALFLAKKNGKNCTMVYRDDLGANAENVVYFKKGIFSEYEPVFRALTAAVDAKDHFTFAHSQNVAYYAAELARACGMNGENIEIAKEAGLLHDIGKVGVPEAVLLKPGRLTPEEYEIMKGHVEQSISILRHLSGMEYVLPAILGHHERYDGNGYPKRYAGEKIPVLARVLCIADAFDAMISKRPYKDGFSLDYAVEQLEACKGTQFDPEMADKFIELLQKKKLQIRYSDMVLEERQDV